MNRRGGRIRGQRIGGGPSGDSTRGLSAERTQVEYFCSRGHRCGPSFAVQAPIPELWVCPHCGLPAGRDQDNPPTEEAVAPYKTHLAYVRERRSDSDAEILLNEALARLRAPRG
ncbi:RNA polymerase-binding protein RbpA [Actinocrinis puniceicyclus]|uniref:RNA polymerase-binding protein RbpA n=1 Tax=Actinocrinis puniceicyclus TaxID=977794 RepID=UPI001FEC7840